MIGEIRSLPRPLWYLFAGTAITRLGTFVFPLLTVYLSEARGFPVDAVGVILAVGSLGLLVGNLWGGWLSDEWSRKRTLVLALVLNALGFLGLAPGFASGWPYALFLFVGYLGSGMYTPAANTVVADLTSNEQRSFAYTVNYVCVNLGMALGPLLGGVLAGVAYSLVFLGDVATTCLCAVLIVFGVQETRGGAPSPGPSETPTACTSFVKVLARHRIVTACCFASFFLIAPLMGLQYAVPLLVKTVYSAELFWVGTVYTINAACILALSFVVERFVRHRNDFAMLAAAGLLWTGGLAILFAGNSLGALLACTVVWTLGEIVASIVLPTFLSRRVAPELKGRFLALLEAMRSTAGVVCPIALGAVWAHRGVPPVLAILLVLPILGTLCFVALGLVSGARRRAAVPDMPTRAVTES